MSQFQSIPAIRQFLEQHADEYDREILQIKLLEEGADPESVREAMVAVYGPEAGYMVPTLHTWRRRLPGTLSGFVAAGVVVVLHVVAVLIFGLWFELSTWMFIGILEFLIATGLPFWILDRRPSLLRDVLLGMALGMGAVGSLTIMSVGLLMLGLW